MSSSVRVRRIDGAHEAYREITVIEIKEVLRLWLQNQHGLRPIAEIVGVDRKTVRRYIEAARAVGLDRDGGEAQLTDGLLGAVVEAVRPERPAGHGATWEACVAEHDRIKGWLEKDLKLTKIADLLERRGVEVPNSPSWSPLDEPPILRQSRSLAEFRRVPVRRRPGLSAPARRHREIHIVRATSP